MNPRPPRRWFNGQLLHLLLHRRQTISLAALALIAGMLFWGRLLMQDVPRTAIAEPEALLAIHQNAPADEPNYILQPPPGISRDLFRFQNPAVNEK